MGAASRLFEELLSFGWLTGWLTACLPACLRVSKPGSKAGRQAGSLPGPRPGSGQITVKLASGGSSAGALKCLSASIIFVLFAHTCMCSGVHANIMFIGNEKHSIWRTV